MAVRNVRVYVYRFDLRLSKDPKVGKESDQKVAARNGCSESAVRDFRTRHGIPSTRGKLTEPRQSKSEQPQADSSMLDACLEMEILWLLQDCPGGWETEAIADEINSTAETVAAALSRLRKANIIAEQDRGDGPAWFLCSARQKRVLHELIDAPAKLKPRRLEPEQRRYVAESKLPMRQLARLLDVNEKTIANIRRRARERSSPGGDHVQTEET